MSEKLSLDEVKKRFAIHDLTPLKEYHNMEEKLLTKCFCGHLFYVVPRRIFSGNTTSCGCKKNIKTKDFNDKLRSLGLRLVKEQQSIFIKMSVKVSVQCYCGKQFDVLPSSIWHNKTRSCGCFFKKQASEIRLIDLTGQRFGRLRVLSILPKISSGPRQYLVECDCGVVKVVGASSLKSGSTKSCRCLNQELMRARSGKDHYKYNPNITDKQRVYRRKVPGYKEWAKRIKERDGYICAICEQYGGELESHHINNWHWCENGKLLDENGITLCKYCHEDFHYIYGSEWNTLEELQEYKIFRKSEY